MLDQADETLSSWIGHVIGNVAVSLAAPPDAPTGEGVSAFLLALANCPPLRTAGRPPLQIMLHYLISTWAATPQRAHQLLGDLAFAAMQTADYTIDLDPLPPETWLALRLAPRPAFVLSMPVRQERPLPKVEYVRSPLSVQPEPMTTLAGQIVGPGNLAIPGARVEIPSLNLAAYSDANGLFRFLGLPVQAGKRNLRVLAKGRQFDISVDSPADSDKPVVIQFDPFAA